MREGTALLRRGFARLTTSLVGQRADLRATGFSARAATETVAAHPNRTDARLPGTALFVGAFGRARQGPQTLRLRVRVRSSFLHLLIQQHPEKKCERVLLEQLVGVVVAGDRDLRHRRQRRSSSIRMT